MSIPARRRSTSRAVLLDRSLEALPVFRLSDSASDDGAISYEPAEGQRWRVLPSPGDRLPGTFDQDVYVELCHRFNEAGMPDDGMVHFTLHAFLRSMGRRVDGRTYEQLRSALSRMEHTRLESEGAYFDAVSGTALNGQFTILSFVAVDRRRHTNREQLALFPALPASEPGEAQVKIAPLVRGNIAAGHTAMLASSQYLALSSPVSRRLYRLLEVAREEGNVTWRVALGALAGQLPLSQRYPSHLQRVLEPAHDMLVGAGVVRDVQIKQHQREWFVDYVLASRLT